MSKKTMTPAAAIVGAALVGTLSAVNVANAAENPFGASQLDSGYMLLAGAEGEGKCGEGKCGGDKGEGEGKCGGDKGEGEGKCGEGKCGGDKG
ncbi:MAG: low-complexity protein [Thiohalocapsa sp.]|nr:low-complexity protein [Thiohalocapsa sp.]MCF7991465.1 low-complexity protein [Thiohalocapsa sp.]